MPTKTIEFRESGGPVEVEIRCGHAQDGAYILTLWDGNQIKERHEGTFLNPDDDKYELQGDTKDHDGRTVQCKVEINIEAPISDYSVMLTLLQDGRVLGVITDSGTAELGTLKAANLFANLESV